MESHSQPNHITTHAAKASRVRCPFFDGPLSLDLLLAELGADEAQALDLALDLRSAIAAMAHAGTCIDLALRLRRALDGRHYLAFYRVRLWLQRLIEVQARAWRGDDWKGYPLPLNSARVDEIENACRSAWAAETPYGDPQWAQVRFAFRTDAAVNAVEHELRSVAA